jgi:dimethylhistidine N-methyltransferase
MEAAHEREVAIREVLEGLRSEPKTLPCKYFYDEAGSALFDRICELDDYYPTRTELGIMSSSVHEMADLLGPGVLMIEYGSGSSTKTELLLDALHQPAAYVPLDISTEHLAKSAARLASRFPGLEILPLSADYTSDFEIPEPTSPARRRVIYFPGSTIGNFDRPEAEEFLHHMAEVVGPGGGLLLGVDLAKDAEVLERAYNDSEGVTAAFNLNLLAHLNELIHSDFELGKFRHRAVYEAELGRIEMHLVSTEDQVVRFAGHEIRIEEGESICTEHSNKFRLDIFRDMAKNAGLEVQKVWTDDRDWFSVQYLAVT